MSNWSCLATYNPYNPPPHVRVSNACRNIHLAGGFSGTTGDVEETLALASALQVPYAANFEGFKHLQRAWHALKLEDRSKIQSEVTRHFEREA